ncbi:LOW QUALITY PROTEIN: hypothetical protein ACHAW6_016144 [Cyclotella cf. meneghiniana]
MPWTLIFMKSAFWMSALKSWLQIPLLRHTPSVTLMVTSTTGLMPLWMINSIPMLPFLATIRSKLLMKVVSYSTRGWKLCCEWKDGGASWQKLTDTTESCPFQVAEFALLTGIANEPAFNW